MALPDLSAYGELELSDEPRVRSLPDAASAAEVTGLDVPQVPDPPRGVTGEPVHQVGDQVTANGEVERVCDRVVILDRGRVAASGTLAELLGQRELRLHVTHLSPDAEARLAAAGTVERVGDWFSVALATDDDGTAVPDLVRDLAVLGARLHVPVPERGSADGHLPGVGRAVGGDGVGARGGVLRAQGPVSQDL